MKRDKEAENIEAIAMRFLSQNDSSKKRNENSSSTLKDSGIFGKMTPSTIHSRTRSKVLSIVSNNIVLAEYNFEFFSTRKVFYKIPNKIIDDIDIICDDDSDECNNETTDIQYNLNYEMIYSLLNEYYYPFIQLIGSIDDFTTSINDNVIKMEKWLSNTSPFEECKGKNSDLYSMTIFEIISIGFVIFLYQINLNTNYELNKGISPDDNEQIYQLLSESFGRLFENLLLVITYNLKNKKKSFEELCNQFVIDFSNEINTLSNESKAKKYKENQKEIKACLVKITEIAINYIYQGVNNSLISSVSSEFIEEINYFEKILLMLKEDKEIEHNGIKLFVIKNLANFQGIILQSNIMTPYLPPIDDSKYKYTLVVDLDETLVHFVEEEDKAYVQVRPYADYFLNEMKKYFEIVIFTAAAEDYADIVLKELDKKNAVNHRLYRKHTLQQNGFFLKDLSKLGRDITKMCIIDNNKENFNLQQENGLHISSFIGEQKDDELLLLSNDLMMIIKENNDDIRLTLKKIRELMNKRYNDQI